MAEPQYLYMPGGFPAKQKRLTGPHAAVWKYDLLTALSVFALGQGSTMQTTVLRLIAAVTARYDWQRDELSIGRAELKRLWQCSEPTVKREIRRLRECGLLVVVRPGVRGRVAAYRLCRQSIAELTSGHWAHAGVEFVERMRGPMPPTPDTNVVSFSAHEDVKVETNLPVWAQVIAAEDMMVYQPGYPR